MSRLMKSMVAVVSLVCLPELAGAAVQGVLSGTTYTITAAGDEEITLSPEDVVQLNLGNTLVKKGKGRLIVNCDLAATYDGEIIVEEGFLRATCGNKTGTCRGLGGATGQVVWKTDARRTAGVIGAVFGGGGSSQLKTAITFDERRGWIFVGTIRRNLFAVEAATGREVWHAKDGRTFFLTTPSAPVVCDDTVFVSGFWMGRYGYDIATGKELWRHTRNSSTVTSEWYNSGIPWIETIGFPKYHEGKVYIATHSHFLEVDPRTGELLREKKFAFSLNCYTEPLILGRRAYFGSPRNGLVCFDLDRFEMVWASPVENALLVQLPYQASPMKCLSSIPVLWKGNIWATAADGAVYCWDKETGRRLRRIETGVPFIASCTVGPDDRLYTADFSGNVRCFDV